MPGNLSVAVTADILDFQTKMALAQANLRSHTSALRSFANDAVAAGSSIESGMLPQVQAEAAAVAAAKAQVAGLRAEHAALAAETGGLTAALQSTNAQFEGMVGFGKLFVAGAIAEGIKTVTEKVTGLATGYAEFGHQLEVASQQTGLSTLQLSGLKLAADENSIAFDSVTKLLTRFGNNLQMSLVTPTGPASRALRALGLDADYVRQHGNDAATMLTTVAQRLVPFTDGLHKSDIEVGLFGQRLGPQLMPILTQLAEEGFGGLIGRAKELGVALDPEAAEKAAKAERAFKDFDAAAHGLSLTIGRELLPGMTNLAKVMTQLAEGNIGKALVSDYTYAAQQLAQEIDDIKKRMETDEPLAKLLDQGKLNAAEFQLGRIQTILHSMGQGATGTIPLPPAITPGSAGPAPGMEGTPKTASEGQEARDLQREMNAELRERIDLITQAQSVDAAYYSRLEADTRLAAAQGKITTQQEFADLTTLENEKSGLYEKELQDKLMLYGEDELAFKQLKSQEEVAEQQHLARLDALNEQYLQKQKQNTKEMSKAWQGAVGEIESAEGTLVSNILTKRQTLAQSLTQIAARLVETEIANDLKALTTKVLLGNAEKAMQQGGMIYHLFVEDTKTAATIAGDTARTASTVTATAVTGAAEATAAKSSVSKHAASAAAAVYDDVAQIPYVGWILAPIAAGAAFVAVEAFGNLIPSFDVGTSYVPQTGLALVHQGEAIIPANQNTGSGGGGAMVLSVGFNISAMDGASVMRTLQNNRAAVMAVIRTAVRNGMPMGSFAASAR